MSDNSASMQTISSQASAPAGAGSETKDAATCACGCSRLVRPGRKYIRGHHTKHKPLRGENNGMRGKTPWNKGLKKETDSRVRKNAESTSRTRKRLSAEGKLVPHNKGKCKDDYAPLAQVSEKVTGTQNGSYGRRAWNKGLTKDANPDLVTYGVPGQSHWNWKGGISPSYGYHWLFLREKVKVRDNHQCMYCSTQEGLVVHHVLPYKESRNHEMRELVTLCRRCHGALEARLRLDQVDDIVRTVQRCTEAVRNGCPPLTGGQ